MLFSKFSHYLSQIEATTKRLEMTQLLAELFKELTPAEARQASYLFQGKLVPKYEPLEFQLSLKMGIRILAEVSGKFSIEELTEQYKNLGDLGLLAEKVRDANDTADKKLSINEVFGQLEKIAHEGGEGSQARKVELTTQLLQQVDALSAKYITRVIVGRLRLGFSDMTIIDALSWALKGDKSLHSTLEDAYQKRVDIGLLAEQVLSKGVGSLDDIHVKVGTPVVPALCQRLNSSQEIIDKMSEVFAEPKYDGTRVQIHINKNHKKEILIRTYTRNLEESSHMFPELQKLAEAIECESCILDAEAIGYNTETDELLNFQQTITRKRKHGVAEMAESIPLRFFIFDILELNGRDLLAEPLSKRKQILHDALPKHPQFVEASYIRTADATELHTFHADQLAKGLEGAVIKKVDSPYQSGRKGYSWVKIKEAEGQRGKLSDTLDCIVLGYFKATGARTDFGIGSMLLGIVDTQENIVTISKVGSGISEDLAKALVEQTDTLHVKEKPKSYQVDKSLFPDVWLSPKLVVEVAADEITTSPNHTAGVALRFPRIIRIREDKGWEQATTAKEVQQLLKLQSKAE